MKELENFEGASPEASQLSRPALGNKKRVYESPNLIDWGSIGDLTHGPDKLGTKDFPVKGGTRGT